MSGVLHEWNKEKEKLFETVIICTRWVHYRGFGVFGTRTIDRVEWILICLRAEVYLFPVENDTSEVEGIQKSSTRDDST